MPDITVFKMEIDDQTFNAPFSGRARSDGASSADEPSGLNVKLVAGLGVVFLLTGAILAFLLKRRFGGSGEDGADDDESETSTIDSDETETETETDEEDEQDKGGIRAIVGLSFLMVTTAVVKRKIRGGDETLSGTIRGDSDLPVPR